MPQSKEDKRTDALIRQIHWNTLPTAYKLIVVGSRRGESARETCKLQLRLKEESDVD